MSRASQRRRRAIVLTAAATVALGALAGCGQVKEKPGNPDSFTSAAPARGALRRPGSA